MKKKLFVGGSRWFLQLSMFLFVGMASAVTLPYTFVNNSAFPDDQIYIAVCGNSTINGVAQSVWIDCKTSAVKIKSITDNTISSPGATTPTYANIFCKLSDIPNKVVVLPEIGSCRVWIGFKSPLYIHFFDTGGNTAPDLNNGTDPNIGIRFEMIELSWGLLNGSPCIWSNTTRVDSYQYPMGLELWGWSDKAKTIPYDKKVGEILHHDEIIAKWKAEAPEAYQGCLDNTGVIKFPTKIASWKTGGLYANTMTPYIDAIWAKYRTDELVFGVQDNGQWHGRVTGDVFNFTHTLANGTVELARVNAKPTQEMALEGSGLFNDKLYLDAKGDSVLNNRNLTIQTQLCAAITRHALDLNAASGAVQDWSDDTKYYTVPQYNWYAAFWHNPAVSYNKLTYAFCYDDVFDKSSTINCPNVERGTVTIGGFASPIGAHYPTVSAGANKSIVLPTNSVSLVGTGVDMDGKTLTYQWTQITTGKATIVSPTSATTSITGLGIGSYVFRLTASNGILSDFSEVKVQVDPDPNAPNLALNKPATASTVNGTNIATKANDGSTTSRWESTFADPQWLKIDLQKVYNVEGIKIIWESAAAKAYTLEVSLDGLTGWKNVFTTSTGNGGTTFISCSETGRFVRMSAATRTTGYGVSIFEFQVFGSDVTTELTSNQIEKISLYPNPVSDVLRISGVNDNSKVDIYSVQGVKVMEHVGQTVDVSSLNSGIYIARFGNTSLRFTKK